MLWLHDEGNLILMRPNHSVDSLWKSTSKDGAMSSVNELTNDLLAFPTEALRCRLSRGCYFLLSLGLKFSEIALAAARMPPYTVHYTTSAISSNMKSKSITVHSLASNCTLYVCRHFTCGISQLFHSSVFNM